MIDVKQVVAPEEFMIALNTLRLAHELLVCRPCKMDEQMTVGQCRANEKADCSMCESALMNEEYLMREDQGDAQFVDQIDAESK